LKDPPFKVPALPTASLQASKILDATPFRRYQNGLKQNLLGRSARLDSVLSTLETCARNIQKDLSIVYSDTTDSGK
jgi:conserved oligomeric Golgi complex subunit 1